MIASSFAEQYGVRLYSKDFAEMRWDEFVSLLSGIGPNTALGRVVSIRAENDKEMLKHFTPGMKKIRDEWRLKKARQMSVSQRDAFLEEMKNTFIRMAGGVKELKG